MMRCAAALVLAAASLAAQAQAPSLPRTAKAPPQLRLLTEESYPSVTMENGRLTGYAYEKLKEALRRAGVTYTVELLPWMRAYTMAQHAAGTCVFPTARTPDREALFTWVAPVAQTEWWLYGLAHRDYRVAKVEDARRLRIGAYLGDVRGEYLKARGYQVDFVQTDEANIRKLMLGRIDLWVTSPRAAQLHLEREGLEGEISPIVMFNSVQLYLACHPATPAALAGRVAAALGAMQRDGTARAIEQRFAAQRR